MRQHGRVAAASAARKAPPQGPSLSRWPLPRQLQALLPLLRLTSPSFPASLACHRAAPWTLVRDPPLWSFCLLNTLECFLSLSLGCCAVVQCAEIPGGSCKGGGLDLALGARNVPSSPFREAELTTDNYHPPLWC